MKMNITFLRILENNYVWIVYDSKNNCIIIDPGKYTSIYKYIKTLKLNLKAIFLTHCHNDHVAGVKKFIYKYPKIPIYGPLETYKYGMTNLVKHKDIIKIKKFMFSVISTPGHTKEHISYYSKPNLFCGDTLFSGGCGKIKTGMITKMYNSLKTISRLPNNTLIYCAHEYTRSNLKFFKRIFPNDILINKYYKKIKSYNKYIHTLPSILKIEKKINPFLRLNDVSLRKKIGLNLDLIFELNMLNILRKIKENKMELSGIEPLTSCVQSRCSPS